MNSREAVLTEGFGLWCRIEDLGEVCGYDPVSQFALLRELAGAYAGRAGQDPDDYAEEHPMQALACYVRRYLAEYPEQAEALTAAASAPAAAAQKVIAA